MSCCGPHGSFCTSLDCPSLYRWTCTFVHEYKFYQKTESRNCNVLLFQEEKPGKESRPVGNAEESNGWIANLVISTKNPCDTVNM